MAGWQSCRGQLHLDCLLVPVVDPGTSHTPGFDVVTPGHVQLGQEYAESVAAGISSVLYAGECPTGTPTERPTRPPWPSRPERGPRRQGQPQLLRAEHRRRLPLHRERPRHAFLPHGACRRTLSRITAAPLRPTQIVLGKLLAIFVTGLATIFVIWAVTTVVFGADWGDPLGVLLMCVGATVAMCGIGVFLTSLAKTEQQAFGITLLVGLFLALLGGNLLPSGSLPDVFQVLALGTPNGWALVGFGRLDQLGEPASSVIGPFFVLLAIAAWPAVSP